MVQRARGAVFGVGNSREKGELKRKPSSARKMERQHEKQTTRHRQRPDSEIAAWPKVQSGVRGQGSNGQMNFTIRLLFPLIKVSSV